MKLNKPVLPAWLADESRSTTTFYVRGRAVTTTASSSSPDTSYEDWAMGDPSVDVRATTLVLSFLGGFFSLALVIALLLLVWWALRRYPGLRRWRVCLWFARCFAGVVPPDQAEWRVSYFCLLYSCVVISCCVPGRAAGSYPRMGGRDGQLTSGLRRPSVASRR